MTIYDVPVADTKFFPVSGDMMRQMKADEERRDRIIRERLAKHRADHLIGILRNENGIGPSAKNDSDAADPNTYVGEQTMQDLSKTVSEAPDVTWHPVWCVPEDDNCFTMRDIDGTLEAQHAGKRYGFEQKNPGHGVITAQVATFQYGNDDVEIEVLMHVNDERIPLSPEDLPELKRLIQRMERELASVEEA